MGRVLGILVAVVVVVGIVGYAMGFFTVTQTQEGSLPNVSVTGGSMPKVDVDAADVNVGTETKTIEVPTVTVTPPAAAPAN
ncbi:hypothetical protein ASG43_20915 [Aureimonas sp. Leaf454]|uniref:hypothetical protein n=1 Tax=Aureimonas sp. Leaf454 TaxID=1736381 RepID=UPI0006FF77BD|nr:hypothetical protein [Aureimonas sp. Leaf454]KQT51954.1 hypothetical protein ASG43_20915 [Aureimonas sp. Leaf454]